MLRRLVFSSFLMFFCLFLFCSSSSFAAEGWKLWLDGRSLGVVPVNSHGGDVFVSLGKMGELLGFKLKPKDDTLVISSGKDKMQVVKDAAAVWYNVQLVPLAAPASFDGQRWWMDSRSALKIMQTLLNSGKKGQSIAWGGSEEGDPSLGGPVSPSGQNDVIAGPLTTVETTTNGQTSIMKAPSAKLKDLRWGKYEDKVRLVLDLAGKDFPDIKTLSGRIEIPFAFSASFNPARVFSPYPSVVKAGVTNFGSSFILSLSHSSVNVQYFSLEDPQRLVVDFMFGKVGQIKPVQKQSVSTLKDWKPMENRKENISSTVTSQLVVIDPGHGGKDPGAVANGIREKDINLQISKRIVSHLTRRGIPARLTRTGDSYLRLQERTHLANEWNAAMFVSIHANALPPGRHATGMEIYLMALPTDKDAMQLALIENKELANGDGNAASIQASDKKTRMLLNILGNMQQNAKIDESTHVAEVLFSSGKRKGLPMRRVAQAPFYVLRGAGMPAILIETGFITEKKEARLLASSSYQEKLAASLAEGISAYLQKM